MIMQVLKRIVFQTIIMISALWMAAAEIAISDPLTEKMLNSTVFVGCELQFQGNVITGGSGSGFLVADSEYVVTNDHVIDYCCPENKLKAIKECFVSYYIKELKNGKLPPGLEEYLAFKGAKGRKISHTTHSGMGECHSSPKGQTKLFRHFTEFVHHGHGKRGATTG